MNDHLAAQSDTIAQGVADLLARHGLTENDLAREDPSGDFVLAINKTLVTGLVDLKAIGERYEQALREILNLADLYYPHVARIARDALAG